MLKYVAVIIFVVVLVAISYTTQPDDTKIVPAVDTEAPNTSTTDKSKTLDLSGQNLTRLPENILSQSNIEELNISNNSLTGALPAEIRQLKNLKVLKASNNKMTGLPAELGQLSNLEVLDVSNNDLTGLPYELANLKNLIILNLTGNNYSTQDLEIIKSGLPKTVQIITN